MGRLEWSGTTRNGGGRRGGTLKLGKGLGTGVALPSEQYSTLTVLKGGGGTSCADLVTWRVGEDGRTEERDREAGASGGTEASRLGGETKSEPGGGKTDKEREERWGLLTWAVLGWGRQGKHVRVGETREGKTKGRARTTYTLALPPRDGSWLLACWVE